MTDLEQKLKNYYENNSDYEHRSEFVESMKALESDPEAEKKPIWFRRYIPAVAALIALALLFGSGWAYLRSRQAVDMPASDSESVQIGTKNPAPAGHEDPAPDTPDVPEPVKPDTPASVKPADPEPVKPDNAASAEPEEPAPVKTGGQVPEKPAGTTTEEPDEPTPEEPDDPKPAGPVAPDAPVQDQPDTPDQDKPDDVKPDDPDNQEPDGPARPQQDDPVPAELPQFGTEYQLSADRETLTMTLLSTGESVELDVTGWREQLSESTPGNPDSSPTYTGHSTIADYIFEKTITYYLTLEEDGSVRVDLDVEDTDG